MNMQNTRPRVFLYAYIFFMYDHVFLYEYIFFIWSYIFFMLQYEKDYRKMCFSYKN